MINMIPFNKPARVGNELKNIRAAIKALKISGDGLFTKKCNAWFEKKMGCRKVLLTTSCTHALEMAALLINVQPGDEIIMPSFTFVSTANAFVLRGAKIVFVDIRPDTMNIDERLIEAAITKKTRAIVPVHYGGVACEMDTIMRIARKHDIYVIEDAAQAVTAGYKGRSLGTIGDLGCYSFHETKNCTCGEGGAIIINRQEFEHRAEIIREKGTNRSQFFRGEVDKYTWIDLGSSYLMSDLNAAFLYAQLVEIKKITRLRKQICEIYFHELADLEDKGALELSLIPDKREWNGHLFFIKTKSLEERSALIEFLRKKRIICASHYLPLHSSPAGKKFAIFCGVDKYTTKESERLLRLPLYYGLKRADVRNVARQIKNFYLSNFS